MVLMACVSKTTNLGNLSLLMLNSRVCAPAAYDQDDIHVSFEKWWRYSRQCG